MNEVKMTNKTKNSARSTVPADLCCRCLLHEGQRNCGIPFSTESAEAFAAQLFEESIAAFDSGNGDLNIE